MSHPNTSPSGASHGSMKSYLIGFILSVILTVIPFWMVMEGTATTATILWTVVGMAVVQIVVHLVCFLHMNTSSEERWNVIAFLFTLLIIGIVVIGSLWIMYNLNINMMMD
ncbi:TPA: cytochrome o ubiquinol oxidase subunit IV [Proteus mirabilis]|uniref:cytochrome o ubiquinol oxidase subunit IV n=1 Tax=Proteus mirabilis TaxID=584 RepID=UPI0015800CC0|nr:cytochrome o ubiquinol oxidase subunit IV [Proteus mirabilis]HEK0625255.1 cytochrome o ubiquinol oxidase subunit IV [Proteus mirabilis]HEK1039774.1 cytochrome o ubiquinol oxidase subunit IV [Proteus mirabilis]HEK2791270.1 cytochrome o ubiquinol oxidase subunit IV [Proteus mirabilis]